MLSRSLFAVLLTISRLDAVEPECSTVYELLPYQEGKPLEFTCSVPDANQTECFVWYIESTAPYSLAGDGQCAERDQAMITCRVDNATAQYETEVILEYIDCDDPSGRVCEFRYRCIFYIPGNVASDIE